MSDIRWWYRSKLMSDKKRTAVMGKNLDDCAALESWLITKSDDNGLDYLSNITAYIAELEAARHDLHTLVIPELQLVLKDAQEKIAELQAKLIKPYYLPKITAEIADELDDTGLIENGDWTQDAVDFACLLNRQKDTTGERK